MDPLGWIGAALLAAAVWWGWTRRRKRPGDPQAVARELSRLGPEYQVLSGVVRMLPEGLDRVDHIVVSPFGVFVLDEVRERGRVECRINEVEWPVRGGTALPNPVWRNRKRLNALEQEFPGVPWLGWVVLVHARPAGERDSQVVTLEELVPRIRAFQTRRLDSSQVQDLVRRLRDGEKKPGGA